MLVVFGSAIMLLFDGQFARDEDSLKRFNQLSLGACGLFTLLVAANGISTVLECAVGLCPDNPIGYLLLR